MKLINKDTKLFCSFSGKPGNFGAMFHNKGFEYHDLNSIYLPLRPITLEDGISFIKSFNIQGVGLSSPYKIIVLNYCSAFAPHAEEIGAINTITNIGGKLVGYNTDYFAVRTLLQEYEVGTKLIILGDGGYSKTVQYVCRELNIDFEILVRSQIENRDTLRGKIKNEAVFSCAPIIFDQDETIDCKFFIDCSTASKTGLYLAYLQGEKQFEIYTNKIYPYEFNEVLQWF